METKKKMSPALFITQAAMIAAVYVVLTYFIAAFGLASGAIQVRISEALTILPVFTPAAIPGLFVGCLLANTLTGAVIWDIVFGSIATLLAAIMTYFLRGTKFLYTIPPVLCNAIIVPAVLIKAYGVEDAYWFLMITVAIGEMISVCGIGSLLRVTLERYRGVIFRTDDDAIASAYRVKVDSKQEM